MRWERHSYLFSAATEWLSRWAPVHALSHVAAEGVLRHEASALALAVACYGVAGAEHDLGHEYESWWWLLAAVQYEFETPAVLGLVAIVRSARQLGCHSFEDGPDRRTRERAAGRPTVDGPVDSIRLH